jgi:hypothetical protein
VGRSFIDAGHLGLQVVERLQRAERKDGATDVLDRVVELVDHPFQAGRHVLVLDEPRRPLHRKSHREKALDHQVVQVPTDPVTILEEGQSLLVAPAPGELQGKADLLREAGRQHQPDVAMGVGVLRCPGEGQHTAHVPAQRNQHGRPEGRPPRIVGQPSRPGVGGKVRH